VPLWTNVYVQNRAKTFVSFILESCSGDLNIEIRYINIRKKEEALLKK